MRKKRIEGDKYYSPEPIFQWLYDSGLVPDSAHILDPCCGNGFSHGQLIFTNRAGLGCRFATNDLDPEVNAGSNLNALDLEKVMDANFCNGNNWWVVTNPPYSLASELVEMCLRCDRISGCAFLLRLTFLEPSKKRRWLPEFARCMRVIAPVNPRPQFREDGRGTDSATVAWFVWDKNFAWEGENPFMFLTDWKEGEK